MGVTKNQIFSLWNKTLFKSNNQEFYFKLQRNLNTNGLVPLNIVGIKTHYTSYSSVHNTDKPEYMT